MRAGQIAYSQPRCAPVQMSAGRITGWYMVCQTCKPSVVTKQKSKKSAQAAALTHMRVEHQWMPNAVRNI